MSKFRELNCQKTKYGGENKVFYRHQSVLLQGIGEASDTEEWRSRATPSSSCWLLDCFSYKTMSRQRSGRNTSPNPGLSATKNEEYQAKEYQQSPDLQKLWLLGFRLTPAVVQDAFFYPTGLFHQFCSLAAPKVHSISFILSFYCKYLSLFNNFINTQKLVCMTPLQSLKF